MLSASFGDFSAHAQGVIQSIRVEGNKRVEPETVRSYLTFSTGDAYDPAQIDELLKALFATGLFQDVRIGATAAPSSSSSSRTRSSAGWPSRATRRSRTTRWLAEVQLKPRAVYTRARVQADVQRILNVYRRQGLYAAQVDPKIINLDNNRIDVVFEINEGPTTKVRAINFIGNAAFSDSQLRYVIATTQTNFLSFLKGTNIYDPDRLNLDRELLRQFYLKNGYADVRIVSATADLDRDGRGFFITFTIEEGERYRFGTIDIESALPSLNIDALGGYMLTRTGRVYNAEKVEKTVEALTIAVSQQGYAFGQVKPRFDRDEANHIMNIIYVIDEGPRVYIERINIVGNFRTEDDVIRREFRAGGGRRLQPPAGRGGAQAACARSASSRPSRSTPSPAARPTAWSSMVKVRGAADRRALLRRRLFHQRRRDRRYQHHRAQPDGQRPVCQARLLGKP